MREQAQIIRWEEPPPATRRGLGGGRPLTDTRPTPGTIGPRARYIAVAAELRTRPGAWAVIRESTTPSGLGAQVSLGRQAAFTPPGDYQGTTRYRNGKVTVYARYLGDGR